MMSKTAKAMPYKYLLFIAMLYIAIDLAAVAVAYRFVSLNFIASINSSASFIAPVSYALGDVVTEVYGYSMARKMIWATVILQVIFAGLITFAVHIPSAIFLKENNAFDLVFGSTLRFALVGSLGMVASNFLSVYVISKLKIPLEGKLFWLRSAFSMLLGFLLVNSIVIFLGFAGFTDGGQYIDYHKIWTMFYSSYSLDVLYSLLLILPATIFAKFLKHKEGVDVYDYGVNYNPFLFSES